MDFFDAQDRARRKSGLLVFYFAMAVIVMIVVLYIAAVVGLMFAGSRSQNTPSAAQNVDLWRPELLLIVAVGTLAIIAGGSFYKTAELRAGGAKVATMLGGRLVNRNTTDPLERRLLNVVEEMAIASGIAVPAVYVLSDEESINAFAAGFTPDDAVIGVNRGTLEYLTRDELQGVIAHEFSHILNGDMRFNLRLIGILHGILLLAIIGYYCLRFGGFSGGNRKGGAAQIMLLGFAAMVVGFVGLFFGRLIKAAVSRQREYLADASAVQFTRNPLGISGALKKIGGLATGSRIKSPEAESASHMFFGSAFRRMAHSPFATHPPLDDRIRSIEPGFDGRFPPVKKVYREPEPPPRAEPKAAGRDFGFGRMLGDHGGRLPLEPAVLIAAVGAPTMRHVEYSRHLLRQLPKPITEALQDTFSARAIVFGLLLDADSAIRERQLGVLDKLEGRPTRNETARLHQHLAQSPRPSRLPLVELAQGTLRGMSLEQYQHFRGTIEALVAADDKITLFEFVLQRILLTHLDRTFELAGPPPVRYHSMTPVTRDIGVLLAAMAYVGHADVQEAAQVYAETISRLDIKASNVIPEMQDVSLQQVGESLDRLAAASMPIKKRLLSAATFSVAADGQVTPGEAEVLRAVATVLDCPIPPIVAGELQPVEAS